ncbi:hypothetical protein GCM10010238_39860 [Streptomyces griseoviridis]|uniref:Uncharacterized protein n=1 Tax=Streptomyces griseoviridis TaxID=45398 RepID=A0A918GLW0_STRGD|nr:hypothetical protein GCM10010238_39860 [Streptomyces niveoruber]
MTEAVADRPTPRPLPGTGSTRPDAVACPGTLTLPGDPSVVAGALVEWAEAGRVDLRDLPAARPEQPRRPLVRGVGRGDLPAGLPVAPLADSWIGFVVYRIVFGEGERVPDEAEIAASVDAALRLRLTPSAAGRSRRVAVPVTHRTHRTAPSVPTGSTGPTGQRPRCPRDPPDPPDSALGAHGTLRPTAQHPRCPRDPSTHRTASSVPTGPIDPPDSALGAHGTHRPTAQHRRCLPDPPCPRGPRTPSGPGVGRAPSWWTPHLADRPAPVRWPP